MRLGTRVVIFDVDGKPTDITGTFHGIGHVQSGHSDDMREVYIVLLDGYCRGSVKPDNGPGYRSKSDNYITTIVTDPANIREIL